MADSAHPPHLGASGVAADLGAGLAAMLVALPSAIAFGVTIFGAASPALVGSGALAGIVGAAVLGLSAPLVGRNWGFITAPCAPAAAVLAGFATEASGGGRSPAEIVGLVGLIAALAAVFQVGFGIARAGRVIKYIPYQVVTGYLSGVAVIIAMGQLPKLFGLPAGTSLLDGLAAPSRWRVPGLLVGLVTMAVMVIAPKLTKRIPGAILGLGAGVLAYFGLGLAWPELWSLEANPHVIGRLPAGGSVVDGVSARAAAIVAIDLGALGLVVGPALTLAALLSIDTLKTGVVLDAMTKHRHDSNRELVAQGVANTLSFALGGIPGAGTMGASLINVTSGSRSFKSSVFEGGLSLLTLLLLGPLVAWVPTGALAGVLLVVAARMFDLRSFRLLKTRGTRLDFAIILAVVVVAEGVGLIQASVVGVCLAIVLFIRDQIRGSVIWRKSDLVIVRSKRRRSETEMQVLAEHGAEGLVVQLQGNLFFGTTDQLFGELAQDLERRREILFDFRRVRSMDFTAGHLFHQMKERLEERGGALVFSGMPSRGPNRPDIQAYLRELDLIGDGPGSVRVFDTKDGALEWIEGRILERHGLVAAADGPPLGLAEMSLFDGLSAETLAELEAGLPSRRYAAGERIFSIGEAGDEMYLVRSGRVHAMLPLEANQRHHLASFARGDFFGEMSFLDGQRRSADLVAATDAELFVVSRQAFDRQIATRPDVAAHVLQRLAVVMGQRLRVTAHELQALEER